MFPNSPPAELHVEDDALCDSRAVDGGADDVMSAASAILAKLNAVPFDQIGDNLNSTLKALSDVANSEQLRQSLASLRSDAGRRADAGEAAEHRCRSGAAAPAGDCRRLEDSVRRANR